MVRVALIGLGAIGGEILRYLIEKNHEIEAVIDNDPAKTGRTVREIAGLESEVRVHRSVEEVEIDKLDVVVFATKSRLSEVAHEIEYVAMQGVDSVTTCEELAYPYYASQALASRLDSTAREKGVTVVGVGVNPGFVMDWVPSLVASASKNPKSIHVVRSVDVSKRRRQLQTKTGVGLTKGRFEKGLRDGTLGQRGSFIGMEAPPRAQLRQLRQMRRPTRHRRRVFHKKARHAMRVSLAFGERLFA